MGMFDVDHRQCDVPLQPGGVDRRGDLADVCASLVDLPEGGVRPPHRVGFDDQPDLHPFDALVTDAFQRGLADEIRLHIEVDQPVETQFIGIGVDIRIGVIGQHAAFDPPDRRGVAGFQPEFQPRCHDAFPQGVALAAVAQVQLIAQLAGPAGARDDQRDAVQIHFAQPIVFQVHDAVAEEGAHDLARLRSLQLQGRYIGFTDLHVQAGMHRHALRPKQDVAVRQRNPEMVFRQAQQDRVVQDTALGVGDQHVFALAHGHLRQVARCQHLDEFRGVGPGDLHLPFHGHVTEDRVVDEVPEVLFRIAEVARDIHVVVDGETLGPPTHRGVEVGGFADLRAKAELVCVHCVRPCLSPGWRPGTRLMMAPI